MNAATLLDGDPLNNYLKRAVTFNPGGRSTMRTTSRLPATTRTSRPRGLVIVSINDPLKPRIVNRISLKHPRAVAIQFRYAFVVDEEV